MNGIYTPSRLLWLSLAHFHIRTLTKVQNGVKTDKNEAERSIYIYIYMFCTMLMSCGDLVGNESACPSFPALCDRKTPDHVTV